MLNYKRNILIIFIFTTYQIVAQDVQFSQLFADRMYLNPAFAGSDYCPKFVLSYRNQWPGIQFPYNTYNASFDKYSEVVHGGIGIRLMKDDQGNGVFNQINADFIYSYHIKISNSISAKFAIEASVYQQSMNMRDLVYYNMIDPVQGIIYSNTETLSDQTFFCPDFSTGIILNYKKYFLGAAISHIPQNLVESHNEFLPVKYTIHAGAVFPLLKNNSKKTNFILEPNFVYINQQNMNMLYYGMYFDISAMSFGLFYRQNLEFHYDAMVVSYHLNVKNLIIGYSYDITLSKFIKQTLGTHELSLTYLIPCDKKIRNYNTISCPSF
jgi:type IX secretion system PorP/SprF family membrane protein